MIKIIIGILLGFVIGIIVSDIITDMFFMNVLDPLGDLLCNNQFSQHSNLAECKSNQNMVKIFIFWGIVAVIIWITVNVLNRIHWF